MVSRLSDSYTRRHLTSWLHEQIRGDECRTAVAKAIVDVVLTDEEYFTSESWWKAYEAANANEIEQKFNAMTDDTNYQAIRGEHYV